MELRAYEQLMHCGIKRFSYTTMRTGEIPVRSGMSWRVCCLAQSRRRTGSVRRISIRISEPPPTWLGFPTSVDAAACLSLFLSAPDLPRQPARAGALRPAAAGSRTSPPCSATPKTAPSPNENPQPACPALVPSAPNPWALAEPDSDAEPDTDAEPDAHSEAHPETRGNGHVGHAQCDPGALAIGIGCLRVPHRDRRAS